MPDSGLHGSGRGAGPDERSDPAPGAWVQPLEGRTPAHRFPRSTRPQDQNASQLRMS